MVLVWRELRRSSSAPRSRMRIVNRRPCNGQAHAVHQRPGGRLRRDSPDRRRATGVGPRRLEPQEGRPVAGSVGDGVRRRCGRVPVRDPPGGRRKPTLRRQQQQDSVGRAGPGRLRLFRQGASPGQLRPGDRGGWRSQHRGCADPGLLDLSGVLARRRATTTHEHTGPGRLAERIAPGQRLVGARFDQIAPGRVITQRRLDQIVVGYDRRELSTCSISRLTCWRSMNSR